MSLENWFLTDDTIVGSAIDYSYNWWLVLLSYLVAIFASYTSFHLIARVRTAKNNWSKTGWLVTGASSMGCGIWSMHFIAMLAVDMPMRVHYDLTITGLSVVFALVASYFAYWFVNSNSSSALRLTAGGLVLGSGVGGMHYAGMAAMTMPAQILYDPSLFAMSIVAAVSLSALALRLLSRSFVLREATSKQRRLVSALVMGTAITLMHYTGMAATHFVPVDWPVAIGAQINASWLGLAIAIVALGLLSLSLVASMFEQVRQGEERLRSIVNTMTDALFTVDSAGRIQTSNAAAQALFGFSTVELDQLKIDCIVGFSESQKDVLGHINKVLAQGELGLQEKVEFEGCRKDTSKFDGEASITKIEQDAETLYTFIVRDISDWKKSDQKLRNSKEASDLLGRIAVAVNEGKTIDDGLQACLKEVCTYLNWPIGHVYLLDEEKNELVSANIWHIDASRNLDAFKDVTERTNFKAGQGLPGRVLASRGPAWIKNVSEDNNSPRAHMTEEIGVKAGVALPLVIGRKINAVLEFYSDTEQDTDDITMDLMSQIGFVLGRVVERRQVGEQLSNSETKLKKSRDLLKATIDNFPGGISVLDADLNFVAMNELFYDLLDLDADKFPVGCTYQDVVRYLAKSGWYGEGNEDEILRQRLANIETFEAEKFERTIDSGRTIEIRSLPLPTGGLVRIYIDVSEHKQAEEVLRLAKEEAELASRVKTDFLANMSHELRTPLNAIIGFSDIIQNALLGPVGSPRYREYAQDINDSGNHLLAIINDILDISKIEAGELDLFEEEICLHSLVSSTLTLVKGRANVGGVKLETSVSETVPLLVADERKIKQILLNLLSNAIKFTPEGGAVSTRAWHTVGSGFVIQVADTGIGISPENIHKALSPFGQIDSSISREYNGTGLGLPLTKSLVEMHGGSLDLQSAVGAGTTVTVRLPAYRSSARAVKA